MTKTDEESSAIKLPATRATLAPSFFNTKQINLLWARTPKRFKHTRTGRGGHEFTYVSGHYVKQVLDKLFGHDWSFEIVKDERIGSQLVVTGKLTCNIDVYDKTTGDFVRTKTIVKQQYGRADIKLKQGTKKAMDIGNDYKAAATDALKKCASELGVARDVYAEAEYAEVEFYDEQTESEEKKAEAVNEASATMLGKLEELDGDKADENKNRN